MTTRTSPTGTRTRRRSRRAYDLQDPAVVGRELVDAGEVLADRFAAVAGDQWSRTGVRSDGAVFTVETFARYLAHDPIHHLWDVGAAQTLPAG